MGYYINPPDMSKEDFLKTHGLNASTTQIEVHDYSSDSLPVCLVDNSYMTAAAIGYVKHETEVFLINDGRPKTWYIVSKELLKPYL